MELAFTPLIEVARSQDGKQLQLLPIMAWQPIDFGASFHADDINFDGYLDFSVLTELPDKSGSRRRRSRNAGNCPALAGI
jgi:hypothetical protein